MGLKILHSADWHLDSPLSGFSGERRELLRRELRTIPGKVADLCLAQDCDLMLLAGDILDGEASRETLDILKRELARSGVPVVISPGNHDFCCPGSPWLEDSWPENVFIFTGGLESVTIQGLDCRIYGAGFQSMDCGPLLEGFRAQGPEKWQLGVFHGDPLQKSSPCNPVTVAQVRRSGLHYLALGHIHKAGTFRAGDTLCAWPGCPMGRGWDETGDKGVCIVTLGDTSELKAVNLDTLRFHELEVDTGSDAAAALEAALPAGGSRDFYRIDLTGWGSVNLPALAAGLPQFPNLTLRDCTELPMDVWADAGEDTLEGVYFRLLREAMESDPAHAHRYQEAAEISRRLLRGKEVTL